MNQLANVFNEHFTTHFIINICSLLLLLRVTYYKQTKNRELLFGFSMFGHGVFIVTALLHGVEFSMGFAFGLFAVFSMLRYRTESIAVRDMTYLFLVIVISLLCAVSPVSTNELILLNLIINLLTYFSESTFLAPKLLEKQVVYDRVSNIQPNKKNLLIKELCERTGLNVIDVEVGAIDYLKDSALLKVIYSPVCSKKEQQLEITDFSSIKRNSHEQPEHHQYN